jgi:hypothetical protein
MTDHAKLARRFHAGDTTVNASGEGNMLPRSVLKPDGLTALIDGFIADGWVRPEDRENEIAWLLQGNLAARERDLRLLVFAREAEVYAACWVERWLDGRG